MFFHIITFNIILYVSASLKNNDCDTYLDYYIRPISKHCWYNPDVNKDMPELVTQHKYPLQSYDVVTKDGYILKQYRIPQMGKSKGVVFLEHPALASCAVFVDKGNVSLAYALYHEGYDVWLGNVRGSYYARKHKTLNPDSNEYWNFSFHEMGIYDIPAQIELASKISNSTNIAFIGWSMSGTSAAIYGSMLPNHAKKYINIFIMMAPLIYSKHIKTPFKLFASYGNIIYYIASLLRQLEFLPRTRLSRTLGGICYKFPFATKLCAAFVVWFMGPGKEPFYQLEPALLPISFSQSPAGISLKCLNHYAQHYDSGGKFQFYSYGEKDNQKYYGSKSPPLYPISNFTVPVYVMAGKYDNFVSYEDVDAFVNDLPKNLKHYPTTKINKFNHINFGYAKDLNMEVNQRIKRLLNEIFHSH